MKLHMIMACHNRREMTVECIRKAHNAISLSGADASFTVYDDGSTDGTYEALVALGLPIQILRGDGSAFWARGMAIAEDTVLKQSAGEPDEFIVWLNDDVVLDENAFSSLSKTLESFPGSVVVGAMRDPIDGSITYSGMRRAGLHPLRFDLVIPTQEAQCVEVFNGNLVVVPVAVAKALGGIDGGFSHALADIDYGLRCSRSNIPVILGPSSYGACSRNKPSLSRGLSKDWADFLGPKGGGNYASLRRILQKSHHITWPFIIVVTYGVWWVRQLSGFRRRRKIMIG
ncbi:glycosyltransferase family 2 protein [Pseudarthrobacter sp. NamE2]|uniref:glycosyltransferase family 2 protein n=1 Tax=Pseudarthrobacter sp. NamE2 TaxID=2576838 RepID=UPI0010FF3BAF|nr:glycosyltransferase [Pseudarthrobacter sp. NamE2]TLM84546.1 glycosyltransferase family 2 protein [Pseudarthrobacter sp. NamE2]